MPNQERAQRVLDLITANETAFDMDYWFNTTEPETVVKLENDIPTCGTTMCLAGWSAVAKGWVLKRLLTDSKSYEIYGAFETEDSTQLLYPDIPDGSYTDFVALGADALDIPLYWAEYLFTTYKTKAMYFLRLLASGKDFDWEEEWKNWYTYPTLPEGLDV